MKNESAEQLYLVNYNVITNELVDLLPLGQ